MSLEQHYRKLFGSDMNVDEINCYLKEGLKLYTYLEVINWCSEFLDDAHLLKAFADVKLKYAQKYQGNTKIDYLNTSLPRMLDVVVEWLYDVPVPFDGEDAHDMLLESASRANRACLLSLLAEASAKNTSKEVCNG